MGNRDRHVIKTQSSHSPSRPWSLAIRQTSKGQTEIRFSADLNRTSLPGSLPWHDSSRPQTVAHRITPESPALPHCLATPCNQEGKPRNETPGTLFSSRIQGLLAKSSDQNQHRQDPAGPPLPSPQPVNRTFACFSPSSNGVFTREVEHLKGSREECQLTCGGFSTTPSSPPLSHHRSIGAQHLPQHLWGRFLVPARLHRVRRPSLRQAPHMR